MNTLLQETQKLRAQYDEEPSHSDHVADLALQIFDVLGAWHKLDPRARELLHSAALLHDIGWSQTPDGRGHHKESARLISEYSWKALPVAEVEIVAQTARYHRKSLPRPDHQAYQALAPSEQKLVLALGGILRVADALDRTHTSRIKKVTGSVTAAALTIRVQAKGSWDEERAMFEIKRDMLELAADRSARCEAEKD
jgi:exopolyphosphatase / guanosine-5'-triphosphate,3'-diphosphate pyrophosphatase